MNPFSVNPTSITDYRRGQVALEAFWSFCILVAGKNADQTARKVSELWAGARDEDLSPFTYLAQLEDAGAPHVVYNLLVANRVGQYDRIVKAFKWTTDKLRWNRDYLRDASVRQLMECPGVGPKTARFFVLHSRPDAQVAVLDTHILRWLREAHGVDAPRTTPPAGQLYDQLEALALAFFRVDFRGLTAAEADLMVWTMMSGRLSGEDVAWVNLGWLKPPKGEA